MTERQITTVQAVREALREALRADPSVIVLGEDVAGGGGLGPPHEGSMGGTFGATKGLWEEFTSRRVRDTPISEAGFVGAAVGAAAAGLRPVVDVMWSSFTPLCFDQIFNQAAKMRFMFGGQARVPLVLRMAMGAGLGAAGQHSDTLYSLFTHIPGLKVVVPSSPATAKGLLLSAIWDDNPVLVFEHMGLNTVRGPVPEEAYTLPLGEAAVVREGADVTVVAVGLMVRRALDAAETAAEHHVDIEVVDPRTLSPLDADTILASVEKTGRLVVADESPPRCNVATDIVALAATRALGALRVPPVMVTAPHAPVPFSPPLEEAYVPRADQVLTAALQVCARETDHALP